MPQRNWLDLVRLWYAHGHTGLTPHFICAACGMQPDKLMEEIYIAGYRIGYCSYIQAPIVMRGEVFSVNPKTLKWLRKYTPCTLSYNYGVPKNVAEFLGALSANIHAVLAENKPSRYVYTQMQDERFSITETWWKFTAHEKDFVRDVLGRYPPEIIGVDKQGRIMYRYVTPR